MPHHYDLKSDRLWSPFVDWPFRERVSAYISRMEDAGYSRKHTYTSTKAVGEYARWLLDDHRNGAAVDEETISRYLALRAKRSKVPNGFPAALFRMLLLLREGGDVPPAPPPRDPHQRLISAFATYLQQRRGLRPRTIESQTWWALRFLREVWNGDDDKLMDIGRTDVIRFVEVSAEGRSRQTIRTMCSGIRSLLRYLHAEGFVVDDLATSVPSPRTWKHSTLPTYLTAAQLQAVLSHCDRTTATGRRDYAILLLLARLGLRANEVATLKLDDIDWGSGSFSIEGKGGRRAVMPLPADVGTAIVDYVQNGRPKSRCRELFLRVETPCTGFPTAAGVILVAQRVLKRAGIRGLASHGSHVFRHTLATEMIQTGATLAEIGEVLRHQDRDTTRIYAKVDLPRLRLLSLEWPGGAQ